MEAVHLGGGRPGLGINRAGPEEPAPGSRTVPELPAPGGRPSAHAQPGHRRLRAEKQHREGLVQWLLSPEPGHIVPIFCFSPSPAVTPCGSRGKGPSPQPGW